MLRSILEAFFNVLHSETRVNNFFQSYSQPHTDNKEIVELLMSDTLPTYRYCKMPSEGMLFEFLI